jgi:biotin carboxylase
MNVDDVVAEKIAAARARAENAKRRRAALAAARQRGLAIRHAAKLRNQASARTTDGTAGFAVNPANDTTEENS